MADSFHDAARRHRSDAKQLAASRRFQNAGHLIGFAAECLTKEILNAAGGFVIDRASGFREHFPALGDKIRTMSHNRAAILLAPIVRKPDFLQGWQAECRYEGDLSETEAESRFLSWLTDVDSLFQSAKIP
jgi:hypothetical protein